MHLGIVGGSRCAVKQHQFGYARETSKEANIAGVLTFD